jgi:Homeodomain-like domain
VNKLQQFQSEALVNQQLAHKRLRNDQLQFFFPRRSVALVTRLSLTRRATFLAGGILGQVTVLFCYPVTGVPRAGNVAPRSRVSVESKNKEEIDASWSLIQERVWAGLRNAKLKGKTLGRPPLTLDHGRIARLRASGASIRDISAQLGVSASTVHKTIQQRT